MKIYQYGWAEVLETVKDRAVILFDSEPDHDRDNFICIIYGVDTHTFADTPINHIGGIGHILYVKNMLLNKQCEYITLREPRPIILNRDEIVVNADHVYHGPIIARWTAHNCSF